MLAEILFVEEQGLNTSNGEVLISKGQSVPLDKSLEFPAEMANRSDETAGSTPQSVSKGDPPQWGIVHCCS